METEWQKAQRRYTLAHVYVHLFAPGGEANKIERVGDCTYNTRSLFKYIAMASDCENQEGIYQNNYRTIGDEKLSIC